MITNAVRDSLNPVAEVRLKAISLDIVFKREKASFNRFFNFNYVVFDNFGALVITLDCSTVRLSSGVL